MAQVDLLCALQELEAMRTAIENQKVRHLQNELEMLHVMQVGTGSIGPRRLRLVRCLKCLLRMHASLLAAMLIGFAGKGALC